MNASVELADSLIADFRHRHNLDVGTLHKTGAKYQGHYDSWLSNQIFELRQDIVWSEKPPGDRGPQDIAPLQFAQTVEQFGIVNIPPMTRIQHNFAGPEFIAVDAQHEKPGLLPRLSHIYPMKLQLAHLKGRRKDVYTFLATAQQTRYAVTPIHTEEEIKVFQDAVSVGGDWFAPHGQPHFDEMSRWWSDQANGMTVFYKLREHLKAYFKTWTEQQQRICSLIGSEKQRQPNTTRLKSKYHSANVLAAASRQHPGLQVPAEPVPPLSSVETMVIDEHAPDIVQMEDVQGTSSVVQHRTPQFQGPLANQQTAIQFSQTQLAPGPSSDFMLWSSDGPRRKPRTCALCHQTGCPGNANRSHCKQLISSTVSILFINCYISNIVLALHSLSSYNCMVHKSVALNGTDTLQQIQ